MQAHAGLFHSSLLFQFNNFHIIIITNINNIYIYTMQYQDLFFIILNQFINAFFSSSHWLLRIKNNIQNWNAK